ncbi:HIT family protein [bacterium]|nr:MAG: HIT family protein [bacterium]
MAQHPEDCDICAKIEQIQRGTYPGFISELETGYIILGDSQYFRGYTLFLSKEPAPDLEDLPREIRYKFLTEMALVSEAVSAVIKPHKMNVESLGNVVPHLHFHLFPRQLTEPAPLSPVWLVMPQGDEAKQYALDLERDGELIAELRAAIATVNAA